MKWFDFPLPARNLMRVMNVSDLPFHHHRRHVEAKSEIGLRLIAAMCGHLHGLQTVNSLPWQAQTFGTSSQFIDEMRQAIYGNTSPLWLNGDGVEMLPAGTKHSRTKTLRDRGTAGPGPKQERTETILASRNTPGPSHQVSVMRPCSSPRTAGL